MQFPEQLGRHHPREVSAALGPVEQLPDQVGLTSLKGIDHLHNLTKLVCRENRLKQCWALAGMGLEELDLSQNQISDGQMMRQTLSKLPALEWLDYSDNCFVEETTLKVFLVEKSRNLKVLNGQDVASLRVPKESRNNPRADAREYSEDEIPQDPLERLLGDQLQRNRALGGPRPGPGSAPECLQHESRPTNKSPVPRPSTFSSPGISRLLGK